MKILGISAYYHDSAAALIVDGRVVAAAQEERFTRLKHDAAFPENAIRFCLRQAEINPTDVDAVVFYEKPFLKFERLLETYVEYAPRGFRTFLKTMPLWLSEKLFQKRLLAKELRNIGFSKTQTKGILFSEHHLSHAASTFFASPYEDAMVLTMDGVGEWDTTTVYHGRGRELRKLREIHFPHSLGLLYSAFTYYCGFKVNSGEYKLMGLAPFGEPRYVDLIKQHLIDIRDDGSYHLNLDYFDYPVGWTMTNQKFDDLFGGPARKADAPMTKRHQDLAASIQVVTEEVVLKMARGIAKNSPTKNLCLAGGVALNCVANGKIRESGLFENIWVQPAAGDAGGALGAALAAYHMHFGHDRHVMPSDGMQDAALGPSYSEGEIEIALRNLKADFTRHTREDLVEHVVDAIINQKAVGWFQGRMEFGPRALGRRSILADPRAADMQKNLNLKVKFRESFRPFAPVVLREDLRTWFDSDVESPYMLDVAKLRAEKRGQIPAVTHVDFTSRLQTVTNESHDLLYRLLSRFKEKTGVGILINTSFNIRGEPIVCSVEDAYRCFMGTDIDVLAIGSFLLFKEDQPKELRHDYSKQVVPD